MPTPTPPPAALTTLPDEPGDASRPVEAVGPCSRPVLLRADTLDLGGLGGQQTLEVRCGSRLTKRCPSCAALYAGDVKAVLRAGLQPEQPGADPQPVTLVTLTASGRDVFGDVHQFRRTVEKKTTRKCRCGRVHLKGDPRIGTPLNTSSYRYDLAADFNGAASRLATVTFQKLGRLLGRKIRIARVVEWQSRGLLHVHALLIGELSPADLRLAVRGGVNPRTNRVISPTRHRGWTWGPRCDARLVTTASKDARSSTAYLAKAVGAVAGYVSKATGEGLALGAEFGARMEQAAVRSVRCAHGASDCRYGSRSVVGEDGVARLDGGTTDRLCRRHAAALRGWGFLGHVLTVSRTWGASLGAARARRRDAAQARAAAAVGVDQVAGQLPLFEQVVVVGPWRVVDTSGRRPRLDVVQELVTPAAAAATAASSRTAEVVTRASRQRSSAPACTTGPALHCPSEQLSFDIS